MKRVLKEKEKKIGLDDYMGSSEVQPFSLNDYYSKKEIMAYRNFLSRDDENFKYPTVEESKVFGDEVIFTLGETEYNAIDWNNFDKTERYSNEKYFVNIEPLEEQNKTEYKTAEEFMNTINQNHPHYLPLKEVYTLVDRNPWYTEGQKLNLLVGISKDGLQMA